MILFLIASGFSLVYGIMGVLNLAHGAFYILGVYFGLIILSRVGNFWLAALAGGVGAAVVGLLLERGLLSRLHKQINEQVLVTFGFIYIFINVAVWIWGAAARLVSAPLIISGSVNIGDAAFPIYRFVIIFVGAAIAAGLWFVIEKTRAGAIVRAGIDKKEITVALGVNYTLVASAVFVLGSFVGGFAGFIGGPVVATQPAMAFDFLLLILVVMVVGGADYIQGTLLGSLIIGLIDSFGRAYFPDLSYFTIYFVMIIVLLVKPSGILSRVK